jgi:hypothetical protein
MSDEEFRRLRDALAQARDDVVFANKERASSAEMRRLRDHAYGCWQALETYLRSEKIIEG